MKAISILIIIVLLLFYNLKFYKVKTQSMSDEIKPGELVLSHKIFWPFRISNSNILAFNNNMSNDNFTYIKRAVGIPGDTIWIHSNYLKINGKEIPHDAIYEMMDSEIEHLDSVDYNRFRMYSEYLLSRSVDIENPNNYILAAKQALLIPEDHYFMIGDNYYESMDSRFWGFIPLKNIKEKVVFVF